MAFLRQVLAAGILAAFFFPARALETAAQQFERLAADAPAERHAGERVEVEVDLGWPPQLSAESEAGAARLHYPMAFNLVAEGWSWQPQVDPESADYYRYKFLPLQSVAVERGEYDGEDQIGVAQRMKILWRYDYFLAFDNLYDFYPRRVDDDAGFTARLPAGRSPDKVAMRAVARLAEPCLSESTTFWKATHGQPTDFTLKKRYLVGSLEEIRFVDRDSGELLATVRPHVGAAQR